MRKASPGAGAAGPGDELGDDRADQREPAADPAIRRGNRAARSETRRSAQNSPREAPYSRNSAQQVAVGAVQPDGRVRHDREKRDDPGADQQRQRNGSFTQMMISGAIATIGVTCRIPRRETG